MVTQSTSDGSLLESDTVQRPLTVTATASDVDVAPKVFELDDLEVYYGSFRAVRDVTLDVRRHEITAFIGPSGCGKTTVLRCLNRMNDLIPGARVEGIGALSTARTSTRPTVSPSEVRRHIGMVFQKPNPFPKSVYDNVAFGPRVNGVKKKSELDDIVEKSLRGAALWDEVKDRLKHSALGMSGGQQQRLCIARAIAVEPEAILMDEPCSRTRPDRDRAGRGAHAGDQGAVHDRHRHPQHAAGRARERPHRVLHRRGRTRRATAAPACSSSTTRPGGSSPTRPTCEPRTTSPDASDEDGAPWPMTFARNSISSSTTSATASRALAASVAETIPRATQVLLDGDLEGADYLINGDDEIDSRSSELEERCYDVLALQAPMAGDLRQLVTAVKMIGEIERSADLAVNICKASRRLYGIDLDPKLRGMIAQMGEQAALLFRLSIDSYRDADVALASALDDIDDLLDRLQVDFIAQIFECHAADRVELFVAVQLALVARFYERIGDHGVNIGERVRYMVTGWLPSQDPDRVA